MCSVRREQLQVRRRVVLPIPVKMVDDFGREQEATELLFHHEPVLPDVAVPVASRVLRALHEDVAVRIDDFSSLPVGVPRSVSSPWRVRDGVLPDERRDLVMRRPDLSRHLGERRSFCEPLP